MQGETAFKIKVQKELSSIKPLWHFKTQEISVVGIPDIIICFHGKFIALELKTNNGVISEIQRYNLNQIRNAHGYSGVLRPDNFELFTIILNEIDSARNSDEYMHAWAKLKAFTVGSY